jgi:hypothetical protein
MSRVFYPKFGKKLKSLPSKFAVQIPPLNLFDSETSGSAPLTSTRSTSDVQIAKEHSSWGEE